MKHFIVHLMLGLSLAGFAGCSSLSKKDKDGSHWSGQYRREDGAYDLFIDQVESDVVEASVVAAGRSPKVHDDVESFLLARITGTRASRIPLRGHDCYLGLEKRDSGMMMLDGCGGEYSGFYTPFPGK